MLLERFPEEGVKYSWEEKWRILAALKEQHRMCTYTRIHVQSMPYKMGEWLKNLYAMINPYITQPLRLKGGQHNIKQKLLHRTSQQIFEVRRMWRSPQPCLKFHKYIWRFAPLYYWKTNNARCKNQLSVSKKSII